MKSVQHTAVCGLFYKKRTVQYTIYNVYPFITISDYSFNNT